MSVRLVSITNPSELLRFVDDGSFASVTPEELIVYIARVSNPDNQMNMETAPKLINYLIKHKHWSPFEFVDVTFEIITRRSIAAQISYAVKLVSITEPTSLMEGDFNGNFLSLNIS